MDQPLIRLRSPQYLVEAFREVGGILRLAVAGAPHVKFLHVTREATTFMNLTRARCVDFIAAGFLAVHMPLRFARHRRLKLRQQIDSILTCVEVSPASHCRCPDQAIAGDAGTARING